MLFHYTQWKRELLKLKTNREAIIVIVIAVNDHNQNQNRSSNMTVSCGYSLSASSVWLASIAVRSRRGQPLNSLYSSIRKPLAATKFNRSWNNTKSYRISGNDHSIPCLPVMCHVCRSDAPNDHPLVCALVFWKCLLHARPAPEVMIV